METVRLQTPKPALRVIQGLARPRRRGRRLRMLGTCAVLLVAGLAGAQRLRASALASAAVPPPPPRNFVVDGRAVRVLDGAAAGDLFSVVRAAAPEAGSEAALATNAGDLTHAVVVPREAVVTRRGRRYVLVARVPDRFEPVAVEILRESEGRALIAGAGAPVAAAPALAPGDRLVAGGAIYLFNMLVLAEVI